MIVKARRAFAAQKTGTAGKVWTTLQAVLQEIMLAKGDTTSKLPHVGKGKAARAGTPLPRELPCSAEA